MRPAHEKRLVHRALSPQTVLVSAVPNSWLPSRVLGRICGFNVSVAHVWAKQEHQLGSRPTLETSIAALGLGTRALNALDRLNVITVSDLLSTPTTSVWGMRGVGHKTRREIGELVKRLQERFPQAPVVPRPAVPDTGEAVASAPAAHSLDLIVPHLVPRRAGAKGAEERVLRLLLGLEQPRAPHETDPETGLRLGDYFANFVDAEGRALAGRR